MGKEHYWRRVSLGLCQWCLKPAMPGMRMCQKHNKLNNERMLKIQKERYWKHVSLGLCGWCSNPAMPGIKVCEYHQEYNSRKKKEYRLRCKANRKCLNCGKLKELTATSSFCNRCRVKHRLQQRKRDNLKRANKSYKGDARRP